MNEQQTKCPVCEGDGKYQLRIGRLQLVKCQRCEGTGRTAGARETNAESLRSSAWLGELEAALQPLERLRQRAYAAKRYDIASMAQEIKLRLSGAMHRERGRSPSG